MLSVTSPNTFNAGTPDGGTPLNINGITLTFNQWNPSSFPGMTLTGVEYRLTSYAYGTYAIANGNQSARFEVELSRLSTSLTGPFSGSPNLIRTNTTFPDISQLFPNVLPNASLTGTTALSTSTPTDFTADSNFLSYVGAGT